MRVRGALRQKVNCQPSADFGEFAIEVNYISLSRSVIVAHQFAHLYISQVGNLSNLRFICVSVNLC